MADTDTELGDASEADELFHSEGEMEKKRLAKLNKGKSSVKLEEKAPDLDDISEKTEKLSLSGRTQYVKNTDKLRFGVVDPGNQASLKFVTAPEYVAYLGRPLKSTEFGEKSEHLISLEGGDGHRTTPGLVVHTFKEQAEKKFPNNSKKAWREQLRLTESLFREVGLPSMDPLKAISQGTQRDAKGNVRFKDGKANQVRQLSGDAKTYKTPFGPRDRIREYDAHVTAQADGRALPDEMTRMKDGSMLGNFRYPNDGKSHHTFQERFGKGTNVKEVFFKSQNGIQQSADHLIKEGKNLQKRMNSYLNDVEYGAKLGTMMIEYGGDFWPVKTVLKREPGGDHADRLENGPSAQIPNNYNAPLNVIVKAGDHIYPVETYSKHYQKELTAIVKDVEETLKADGHEVNLHKGDWDYEGSHKYITRNARDIPPLFVEKGKEDKVRLVAAVGETTKNFDKSFPPAKQWGAKVDQRGIETGMWGNMATMDPRDVSAAVKSDLKDVGGSLTIGDRTVKVNDASIKRDFDTRDKSQASSMSI